MCARGRRATIASNFQAERLDGGRAERRIARWSRPAGAAEKGYTHPRAIKPRWGRNLRRRAGPRFFLDAFDRSLLPGPALSPPRKLIKSRRGEPRRLPMRQVPLEEGIARRNFRRGLIRKFKKLARSPRRPPFSPSLPSRRRRLRVY